VFLERLGIMENQLAEFAKHDFVGGDARPERRPLSDLPSYELRGYRLAWDARDHDGTLLGSGGGLRLPRAAEPALGENALDGEARREVLAARVPVVVVLPLVEPVGARRAEGVVELDHGQARSFGRVGRRAAEAGR